MSRQARELLLLKELEGKVPSDARKAHLVLHARDQGVCGICGTPVDISLRHRHPGSATMDHILHKSRRGSTHSWHNLRLAHRQCNLERNQFEVTLDAARERLLRAIRRHDHPEIYLPMDVEKAACDLDLRHIYLQDCRAAVAKQQAVTKKRALAGKGPTWRLQAAIDDLERAERYVLQSAQREKSLLQALVVQFTAISVDTRGGPHRIWTIAPGKD